MDYFKNNGLFIDMILSSNCAMEAVAARGRMGSGKADAAVHCIATFMAQAHEHCVSGYAKKPPEDFP
ncbi:hypothetical protein [Pollutimonas bauzanensis]|uniref:Uncharacterized protein n=1 Tax=Pollutimonas bauzanensis TaxID=658167 RepID=A0A1M6BDD3_9BURK|nr:hypothetical protein [Pollutimonas bauzanensis]SHI46725.1 hypothetical protein SAMN04488135_1258 [Pollutimonas bauzanensis]